MCDMIGLFLSPALTPPTVTIAQTPPAYAGSTYTLTCQVTVPDGIVVSGNPQVEFEGPGTSDPVTGTVFGGNNVYFSTYSPMLTLSSGGDYTCSATYSVNGDTSMSPVGSATLTVDVLSKTLRDLLYTFYLLEGGGGGGLGGGIFIVM